MSYTKLNWEQIAIRLGDAFGRIQEAFVAANNELDEFCRQRQKMKSKSQISPPNRKNITDKRRKQLKTQLFT